MVTGKVWVKCEDEEENWFYLDNFQKFVWNFEEMYEDFRQSCIVPSSEYEFARMRIRIVLVEM